MICERRHMLGMIPLAHRSPIAPDDCHLAKTIDLLGDRWLLLILRSALFGVRRFDDFQKELSIPRTILSGRLNKLTTSGVMEKRAYKEEGKRARPEYLLTDKGEALRPILIALMQWGDEHVAGDTPAPIRFTHAASRKAVHAGFVDEDGQAVAPTDIRIALRR